MSSDPTKEWRPAATGARRSVVYGEFEHVLLQAQEATGIGMRWATVGELYGLGPDACSRIIARFGFDGTVPPEAAEEAERTRKRLCQTSLGDGDT